MFASVFAEGQWKGDINSRASRCIYSSGLQPWGLQTPAGRGHKEVSVPHDHPALLILLNGKEGTGKSHNMGKDVLILERLSC